MEWQLTMRKTAIGIVVGLIVVVAAAAIVLASLDYNAYRSTIAEMVKAETGRELRIAGELDLQLSLNPRIEVRDVGFANMAGGTRPEMVKFDRLVAEVELWPMLTGDLAIKRLLFSGVDILLETAADGQVNWQFERPGAATPSQPETTTDTSGLPQIRHVVLEDIRLAHIDGQTGTSNAVRFSRLEARSEGGDAPINVDLDGAFNDKPFNIRAELAPLAELTGDGYPVSFEILTGVTAVIGSARLGLNRPTPYVSVKANAERIDLRDFLPDAPEQTGGAVKTEVKSDEPRRVFPDDPLPTAALKAIDADVELAAKEVRIASAALSDVAVKLNLAGGKLTVSPFTAAGGGGNISGELVLDGSKSLPALTTTANIQGLDLGQVLKDLAVTDLIEGTADMDLNLAGRGHSVRQLMAGLVGRVSVAMDQGKVASAYLDLIATDLLQEVAPWAKRGADTQVNCMVSRFNIKDGLAQSDGLLLDTAKVTIQGDGDINLKDETLEMVLRPRPKDTSLLSLATPINVGGTLAEPSFSPSKLEVAKKILGLVVTATNPLGVLIVGFDTGVGDKNPCLAALDQPQAEPGATPAPAEVTSPQPPEAASAPRATPVPESEMEAEFGPATEPETPPQAAEKPAPADPAGALGNILKGIGETIGGAIEGGIDKLKQQTED